jgi:molybdopterin-guanine dinucleotide biosynthesis protein A
LTSRSPVEPVAAGFVLAGGRSSRMGREKALVELGGRTLAARAVDLLGSSGLTATIAGARSDLQDLAPVILYEAPDRGPLGGICAAMASTEAEFAVFIPVDLPLLPASLLKYLLRDALVTGSAVTLPSVSGFAQSFPVVLCRETLSTLQAELRARPGGCFSSFQSASQALGQSVRAIPVEVLVQSGQVAGERGLPPFQWFLNVNAPADLERARLSIA